MSDLLNSASLVMIPSGYKEDVVYSQIPTSGAGDLSFTRASNGTRINSAGLVEVCPWNLLEYSEDFSSGWIGINNTITANTTTAPNGTTTADTFTLTPSLDSSIYQSVNGVSNNYTISVYAKYVSGDKYLYLFSPFNSERSKVWFDIQNGTVSNQLSGFTGTIEDAGNGWYRCSMYNTNQVVLDYIQFGISTTNSSRTLSNNSVSYFWGAQVNVGTAKPYFPTTDRLNVPRLTYQNGGGGCPSLLLEKQSTNLIIYSEQFDNADWTKIGSTITANNTTSPDGTQNADKLVEDTSTGNHRIVNTAFAVNNGNAHSQSWYVKYFNNQWIQLNRGQEGSGYLNFDLINGVVGYTGGITDYQISNMANGWYRISINYVVTGTYATAGISILDTNINARYESYVGDGTSGVYIWGCQYEQSSYPTSYIPTTSSSATRVADACSKTGISSLIGGGTGTWFMDFEMVQGAGSGNPFAFDLSDGTTSNRLFLYWGESSQTWNWGGVDTSITLPSTLRKKVAVKYSSGTGKLFCNGSLISTLSLSTAFSRLDIGQRFSNTFPMDGKINQAYFLTTSLTDAECQAITTI